MLNQIKLVDSFLALDGTCPLLTAGRLPEFLATAVRVALQGSASDVRPASYPAFTNSYHVQVLDCGCHLKGRQGRCLLRGREALGYSLIVREPPTIDSIAYQQVSKTLSGA